MLNLNGVRRDARGRFADEFYTIYTYMNTNAGGLVVGLICSIYKKGTTDLITVTIEAAAQFCLKIALPYSVLQIETVRGVLCRQISSWFSRRTLYDGSNLYSATDPIDKFREYKLQIHHLFVDFKTAYDSVKQNKLWQIMIEHGFSMKLIRLIHYAGRIEIMRTNSGRNVSRFHDVRWTEALEGAEKRANVQRNGTFITKSHMLLGFADDIDIIGIDRMALEEAYGPFKREAARLGLINNSAKTKYVVAGRERGSPSGVSAEVELDGERFEVVDAFIYSARQNDTTTLDLPIFVRF